MKAIYSFPAARGYPSCAVALLSPGFRQEGSATAEHFYDNMLANIKFESGALGNISGVCPCDYGYDARVEIVGKKGIMQIGSMQGMDVVVCIDREQGLVTPIYRRWPERFRWGYILEVQHFIECVQTEQQPKDHTGPGRGWGSPDLAFAVEQSRSRTGRDPCLPNGAAFSSLPVRRPACQLFAAPVGPDSNRADGQPTRRRHIDRQRQRLAPDQQ